MSKGPDNVVEEVKTVNKNRTTGGSPNTYYWVGLSNLQLRQYK